jgi:hypothetical protein
LVGRAARRFYTRRWQAIRIVYQGGPEILVPIGFTILEASRFAETFRGENEQERPGAADSR